MEEVRANLGSIACSNQVDRDQRKEKRKKREFREKERRGES